jgi:hypothetical protein
LPQKKFGIPLSFSMLLAMPTTVSSRLTLVSVKLAARALGVNSPPLSVRSL